MVMCHRCHVSCVIDGHLSCVIDVMETSAKFKSRFCRRVCPNSRTTEACKSSKIQNEKADTEIDVLSVAEISEMIYLDLRSIKGMEMSAKPKFMSRRTRYKLSTMSNL